ncbi:cupin [Oleiphilus messinensis]|uniref:Cupin n=1 Tax=Oleiphilus messinensis TaxID=141451 RepID=A0A1Y0II14_9GAMM|nr:hypothetical protein [Oleiphilus messinensis]ARU59155.1 cupin [Oleiphilus messinensis]
MNETFKHWETYWGELVPADNSPLVTTLFGYETVTPVHQNNPGQVRIADSGACFGFITQGRARISDHQIDWQLRSGQWFVSASGLTLELDPETRLFIAQRQGYRGLYAMGGPVEQAGRLRYIDGCSDTLLGAPPVQGDPCLNLLHFPAGIEQTQHTHPSLRAGIVASGMGECVTPTGNTRLTPGKIFHIPAQAQHSFRTGNTAMDIIAFHPDSDWGPTHENHPMLNRTWVDGKKIQNSSNKHIPRALIQGQEIS